LADYGHARDLLLDAFNQAATGGVSPEVREAVNTVAEIYAETGEAATRKEVSRRIGLSSMGAWYRLQKAIDLGYVVNQEIRSRQPAKLVPGESLPEERPALPTVEEVERVWMGGSHPRETDFNGVTLPESQTQSESASTVTVTDTVETVTPTVTLEQLAPDSNPPAQGRPLQRYSDNEGDVPPTPPDDGPTGWIEL
jgi:hypothetical protein